MARAQGKHREFSINWSVATLVFSMPIESEKPKKKNETKKPSGGYQMNSIFPWID